MAKLCAIPRCSLPTECAAHGDDAAPSRRLRSLHFDSRHPVWRPHQILPRAKRGHLVRGAAGEYHRSRVAAFYEGESELDRQRQSWLVAIPCGGKQPPRATPGFSFSCTIAPFFLVLCCVERRLQRAISRAALIPTGHSDEAGNVGPFRYRVVPGDRVKCVANAV
jgi:hypothetical protein